mmetsp:Transcript_44626/g.103181  ORF Transcript_44626/g.103181 Transcript_44626/m.103181 type:complete len:228 (+) Transcript_44626:1192-1875(+)
MSFRHSTSCGKRSLPATGCIPSHHPWYAPPKVTTRGLWVLKRATRTAHITASVPDMWKDTSSCPDILRNMAMLSSTVLSKDPRKRPCFLAELHPSSMNSLYFSYPQTLTPYEPLMSMELFPSKSTTSTPSVRSKAMDGSRYDCITPLKAGKQRPEVKRRSEIIFFKSAENSWHLGYLVFHFLLSSKSAAFRRCATSDEQPSQSKNCSSGTVYFGMILETNLNVRAKG